MQPVTCLTVDTCLTADPEVRSSIPAGSHSFVEIDHEIISVTFFLTSSDLSRVVAVDWDINHQAKQTNKS